MFIVLSVPRIGCRDCGAVKQIKLRFADDRVSYTHAFERYVLELSRMMTIQDIARHLGVGWDMVKEIQKRHLLRHYAQPKLKHLRYLAIDEFGVAKGHRYLTVVLDLASGAVVFVGDGKGGDALAPFFKRLRRSKPKIEASPSTCPRLTSAPSRSILHSRPSYSTIFTWSNCSTTSCPSSAATFRQTPTRSSRFWSFPDKG